MCHGWLVAAGALLLLAPTLDRAALAASAPPPAKGHSEPTAPSAVRRDGHHSATALADGKVLVAGGGEPAEVFDPATATWTPTGPMVEKRSDQTATLLDGPACQPALHDPTAQRTPPSWCNKVLVVGGVGDAGVLVSAELFDPATATWAPTGSLALRRYAHTATALADGKVLVAGGLEAGHGPFRREAEIYDPTTGKWSSTGSMGLGRAHHSATLVDAKVLVTGGQGAAHDKSLNDAELFDPATATWAAVPHLMSSRRAGHSATLLAGGKVLLAGGSAQREGQGPTDVLATAEIYDAKTSSFLPAPSMGARRVAHTATLLPDGRVYVVGGAGVADEGGADEAASAEVFDPTSARWLPAAPVTAAPRLHTATLLGPKGCGPNCGKVLVVSPESAQLSTPPGAAATPAKNPGDVADKKDSNSAVLPIALVLAAVGVVVAAVVVARRRRSAGWST